MNLQFRFKRRQIFQSSSGRAFKYLGPAAAKERSPNAEGLLVGVVQQSLGPYQADKTLKCHPDKMEPDIKTNRILYPTGSQCREYRKGLMWS